MQGWLATAPDPALACGHQLNSSKITGSMLTGAAEPWWAWGTRHARLFCCFAVLLELQGVFLSLRKINITVTAEKVISLLFSLLMI